MGRGAFFTEDARAAVRRAVAEIELQTSAEIVVAVRRCSATYREADYLAGSVAAFGVLLLLLFHPFEVPVVSMPLQVLGGFALGAFGCSAFWPLKRALTWRSVMDEAVARAARSVFVDRGVSRTAGRNGVLVLVSVFERRVEVVCDVGIDMTALGAPFGDAIEGLRRALAKGAGISEFTAGLLRLGPALAQAMPRQPDDVNELPDDAVDA